jgi:hypothetical protein
VAGEVGSWLRAGGRAGGRASGGGGVCPLSLGVSKADKEERREEDDGRRVGQWKEGKGREWNCCSVTTCFFTCPSPAQPTHQFELVASKTKTNFEFIFLFLYLQ